MSKISKALLSLVLLAALAGPALAGTQADVYRIGSGDVLEINVWEEEQLTRTLKVRVDGMISLPLVDDIQAAGRTPGQLKEAIEAGLSEYIEQPEVTVIVEAQVSQQFYAIGEILKTGAYPLQKNLSVVQAIALVGGFTEWADKDEIILLRRTPQGEKRMVLDFEAMINGQAPEQNLLLQRDDTLIVP